MSEGFDPTFPVKEIDKKIETEQDFHKWIEEEAKKTSDFLEYYKKVQHKFLDLMIEGKNIGYSEVNQSIIRKETYKIAGKNDEAFIDFIEKFHNIGIQDLTEEKKLKESLSYEEYQKYTYFHNSEIEKRKKDIQLKIADFLEEYQEKVGDYKIYEKYERFRNELENLSYRKGELAPKMSELNKKGIAIENAINYDFSHLLEGAYIELVGRFKTKVEGEGSTVDPEDIPQLGEKLFGEKYY